MKKFVIILCGVFAFGGCQDFIRNRTSGHPSYKFLVIGQSNSVSPANTHGPLGNSVTTVNGSHGPLIIGISWFYLGEMIFNERNHNAVFYVEGQGNQTAQRLVENHLDRWEALLQREQFDFIIFIQGESEVAEKIPIEATREAYNTIFDTLNKYHPPERTFLVKTSAITPISWSHLAAVIRVQDEILQQKKAVLAFNMDDLRRDHPEWFNDVPFVGMTGAEFDREGLKKHAEIWMEVLKPYF